MPEKTEPSFGEKIQSLRTSLAQVQTESESVSQPKECHSLLEILGGLCGQVKVVLDAMEELEKTKEDGGDDRPRKKLKTSSNLGFEYNSGDEGGLLSENPMTNDVILKNLFDLCEFKDLRRLRLVCRRWHNLSLPRWRNNAVVNIVSNHKHEQFSGRYNRNYLSFSSSVSLHDIPSASAQPYRNFKLHYWQFPEYGSERKPAVQEEDFSEWEWELVEDLDPFWSGCGHWMYHLNLSEPIIANGNLLRNTVLDKTPNLRSLKITHNEGPGVESLPFENDDERVHSSLQVISIGYEGIPWKDLFKCFPNLKVIECGFAADQAEAFLNAINDLNLNERRQLDLRSVSLSSSSYYRYGDDFGPDVDFLNRLLSLKYLRFRDTSVDLDEHIDEAIVSNLFKSHSSTLQKLVLAQDGVTGDRFFRTAFSMALASLTKLEINANGIVPNLHFLEHTPNLRELKFKDIKFREVVVATDATIMERVQLEKLEEIAFSGSTSELQDTDLELIADMARNVRVFTGPLDNNSFWKLCDRWPQLRRLTVNSPSEKFDDFGLTGKLPDRTRMPNITNLKYLYEFRTDSPLLSDDSIKNGFMQMTYLHCLKVTLAAITSNEAYLELWTRFRSIHVSRDEKSMPLEQRLNEELKRQAQMLARDYDIC